MNEYPDTDVIDTRLNMLRRAVAAKGYQAVLLSSPENIRYFSGFFSAAYTRPLLLIVQTTGGAKLFLPSLEEALARRYARVPWQTYQIPPPSPESRDMLREAGLDSRLVALEMNTLPVSIYILLREVTPKATLVDLGDITLRIRAVKDVDELDLCRRAGLVCRTAAEAAIATTQIGARELEIKAVGEEAGYRAAANLFPQNRFWIYANVVAGCRTEAAAGHDLAGGRSIKPGDMVVHVWHISCDGYWSAIVRTVLIDEVDQQARTVHRVVHEVQQEAKESIKAGVIASDLAKRARERLNYEGLGKYFRGIVGRGIGLSWAEAPSISLDSDDVLQPGMVLRVECVVFSQGLGGFGIEDTVVVSRDGTEALTV